jgi:hypothetical protein
MRIMGLDIHRAFAETVALESGGKRSPDPLLSHMI